MNYWLFPAVFPSLMCGLGGLDKLELLLDPNECRGLLPASWINPPTVVEVVVLVISFKGKRNQLLVIFIDYFNRIFSVLYMVILYHAKRVISIVIFMIKIFLVLLLGKENKKWTHKHGWVVRSVRWNILVNIRVVSLVWILWAYWTSSSKAS